MKCTLAEKYDDIGNLVRLVRLMKNIFLSVIFLLYFHIEFQQTV